MKRRRDPLYSNPIAQTMVRKQVATERHLADMKAIAFHTLKINPQGGK